MEKVCNHDLNDKNTTIMVHLKNKKMAHPEIFGGVCKLCKKIVVFIKTEKGYIEK